MSVVLATRSEGEKNWRCAAATPAAWSAASSSAIAKRPYTSLIARSAAAVTFRWRSTSAIAPTCVLSDAARR